MMLYVDLSLCLDLRVRKSLMLQRTVCSYAYVATLESDLPQSNDAA
jgi:hypothetical protein